MWFWMMAGVSLTRFAIWLIAFVAFAIFYFYAVLEAGYFFVLGDFVAEGTTPDGEAIRFYRPLLSSSGIAPVLPVSVAVMVLAFGFAGCFDFPRFRPFFQFHPGLVAGVLAIIVPIVVNHVWRFIEIGGIGTINVFRGPLIFERLSDATWKEVGAIGVYTVCAMLIVSFNWFFPNGPARSPMGLAYRYGWCLLLIPATYTAWSVFAAPMGRGPVVVQ